MLEISMTYTVAGTVCQARMRGSRISAQMWDTGRTMVKFPMKDGVVVDSDTRNPGLDMGGIHSALVADCGLVIIREAK